MWPRSAALPSISRAAASSRDTLQSWLGKASAHFVRQSVKTIVTLCPWKDNDCWSMCIATLSNAPETGMGLNGMRFFLISPFFLLHNSQLALYFFTCFNMPNQKKHNRILSSVFWKPWSPPKTESWHYSRISCLSFSGMTIWSENSLLPCTAKEDFLNKMSFCK